MQINCIFLEPAFRSYSIRIETEEEHEFIKGLFYAMPTLAIENCSRYSPKLHQDFHQALSLFEGQQP